MPDRAIDDKKILNTCSEEVKAVVLVYRSKSIEQVAVFFSPGARDRRCCLMLRDTGRR